MLICSIKQTSKEKNRIGERISETAVTNDSIILSAYNKGNYSWKAMLLNKQQSYLQGQ